MPKKKKIDKAFIEKIKSLNFGGSSKADEGGEHEVQFCGVQKAELHATCLECGTTTKSEVPVAVFRRRRKPSNSGEQAFSA